MPGNEFYYLRRSKEYPVGYKPADLHSLVERIPGGDGGGTWQAKSDLSKCRKIP